MGWLGGKKHVIKPAAGAVKSFDAEPHHVQGRRLLVDVSGVLHKAARRGAKQVTLTGTSPDAEAYVANFLDAVVQMGAEPVLVFDGCAYPPKKSTQQSRRAGLAQARAEAERLETTKQSSAKQWKKAASVQEPLVRAVMAHCVRRRIDFIVAPYEADTQLVACLEAGQGDCVLVASDDSDLVALGATDAIYEFDVVQRTGLRVQVLEDILGQVVGELSFVGWNYDRFVLFCILCKCDFLDNIPGWALKRVHKAMHAARLAPALLVPAGQQHPPLANRPAAWREPEALRLYIEPVLRAALKTQAQRDDWAARVLAAYHAMRHHPVFRPAGMDTSLAHTSLSVAVASPLEPTMGGQPWADVVPGVQLHASAEAATLHARGLTRAADGLPRDLVFDGDDSGRSEDGPQLGSGAPDAIAARAPNLTLQSVESAKPEELRAWLVQNAALEPYAADGVEKLRAYARQLLRDGVPAVLAPVHPLLGTLCRADPHLRPLDQQLMRGDACWAVAKRLSTQHRMDVTTDRMERFLPFAGTQRARARACACARART